MNLCAHTSMYRTVGASCLMLVIGGASTTIADAASHPSPGSTAAAPTEPCPSSGCPPSGEPTASVLAVLIEHQRQVNKEALENRQLQAQQREAALAKSLKAHVAQQRVAAHHSQVDQAAKTSKRYRSESVSRAGT